MIITMNTISFVLIAYMLILTELITYHLPDLHYVVFRYRTYHPWLVLVPRKVRDLGCVSTMNELSMHRISSHCLNKCYTEH